MEYCFSLKLSFQVNCACIMWATLSKLCILDADAKFTHTYIPLFHFHAFSPRMHSPNNCSVSALISDTGPSPSEPLLAQINTETWKAGLAVNFKHCSQLGILLLLQIDKLIYSINIMCNTHVMSK